ncbi:peroxin 7 [Phellopilus nigrolimitatus]|nr:peroxin 7 [Phellopilus nigrolimitatus]
MTIPPSILHTPGFAHYSIIWSPFRNARFAVSSSANSGLVGNGRLHLVSLVPGPGPQPALGLEKQYPTQDGLYDVAWSEINENQFVTASGDGSLRLWDVTLNWNPERGHSLTTLQAAQGCVYQALFSPHHPDLLASCSSDGTLRLFDLRAPALLNAPTSLTAPLSTPALTVPLRGHAELLTLDWNKYRSLGPLVGGVCETELVGDEYAVRKGAVEPAQSGCARQRELRYDVPGVVDEPPSRAQPTLEHQRHPH